MRAKYIAIVDGRREAVEASALVTIEQILDALWRYWPNAFDIKLEPAE